MYNRLCKYLKENNILNEKQFGFQEGYSISDAIVQPFDKIFDSFEKEQFILGVFIDLSRAFDTVDNSVLLKKLKLCGITDKNLAWFQSYLSNRQQYIETGENSKIDPKYVTCGIPQGSILGPFLFLVFVNNLPNASRLLDLIMFADDTNHFFDIKHLFTVVNNELVNINDLFTACNLSLNVQKKPKYSFFHKPSRKDDISLRLPKLIIMNYKEVPWGFIRPLNMERTQNLAKIRLPKTQVYYIKPGLIQIKKPCYAPTTHIFTPT